MQKTPKAIGRVKTVLASDDAVHAVITSVVVQAREADSPGRVSFAGPAGFADGTARHIGDVVVPIAERILQDLGVPPKSFEISLVNLGATATADIGLRVSGFSADVPILLGLLSAGLLMPVAQDLVATGHVASTDGDIALVRAIPAKLAAAQADTSIRRFVYPATAEDGSLSALSPAALGELQSAIAAVQGRLRLSAVGNVAQLVVTVFDDEDIVEGGLHAGFFGRQGPRGGASDAVSSTVARLAHDSDARFWKVLEWRLLVGEGQGARQLLHARATFQIGQKTYPAGFGRRLLQLVRSLPPGVRRLKTTFPLLPMEDCIGLSQLAQPPDHEDVRLLYEAAFGRNLAIPGQHGADPRCARPGVGPPNIASLDAVLAEIDPGHLAQKIGLPIDLARAGYTLDCATAESYEEFAEIVTAFYVHLLQAAPAGSPPIDAQAAAADAQALLERAFQRMGGFDAAFAEARDGTRGGLRYILDMMADRYKLEEQGNHVRWALKAAVEPLEQEAKVAFIEALLARLAPHLPEEIRSQPAERFAHHYEAIIQAYVGSMEQVTALLRRL